MTSAERASEIVFRGIDGNECEEFIAAIEELAFTEGWSHDQGRMLLFARSRLRHKALRWFARLDPSKKKEWDLFVEALFDHYPLVEGPPEVEAATPAWSETAFSSSASTAILPSDQVLGLQQNARNAIQTAEIGTQQVVPPNGRPYDPSILGRQLGILRVVVEDGTPSPQYVSRGRLPTYSNNSYSGLYIEHHDQIETTIDRQEALAVCFIPSTEPHQIGCLNATNKRQELFLHCSSTSPLEYELRVMDGVIAIKDNNRNYSDVSNIWNVLPDGSLEASLVEFDPSSYDENYGTYSRREDFKTTQVHLETSGTSVRFVKPGSPLRQDDPTRNTQLGRYEVRGRLVFAPL